MNFVDLAGNEKVSNHYDQDLIAGSARIGWVKVGLISDLSSLVSEEVTVESEKLRRVWQENWSKINESEDKVQLVIAQVEAVRQATKLALKKLR